MENKTVTLPNQPSQTQRDNDEIDLGRLFGLLIDHKWLIGSITITFMMVGVVYATLATPIYQADALLQVEKKSSGIPALGELGDMFATDSAAVAEIEIMKSRMVVGAVVDQLQLINYVKPNYLPYVGDWLARRSGGKDTVLLNAFKVPEKYRGEELTLEVDDNNYQLFDPNGNGLLEGNIGERMEKDGWVMHIAEVQTPNTNEFTLIKRDRLQTIRMWQKALSISERGKQTGILQAQIEHSDAVLARSVLDAISKEYMLQNIRRNAAEAENSLAFLEQQLPSIKDNLSDAENQLNAYRMQSQSVDLSIETSALLNQIVELEKRINELTLKETDLSRLYTKEHPMYKSLLEQKQSLEADKERLQQKVQELPETQQQVLRYTRNVQVGQEIYVQLLNRMQELNVLKAGTVGNVRILDNAVLDANPIAPKKSLIVVLVTMLGGILSIGIVFVKVALHRGVETTDQLENEGINVYASVPKSDIQETMDLRLVKLAKRGNKETIKAPLLAKEDPTDLAIEALRGLRTSLHFAMLEARNNVIMISGPSPAVGKSFITSNLAAVLAQAGQRVLLIDGDIRRGYLHNMLSAKNNHGLADLLVARRSTTGGEAMIDASLHVDYKPYIQSGYIENLDFMPRGTAAPNPAELLMHPRMKNLMEQVSKEYDYVLIDTPPILAVTDAAIVGSYAGTTLLVARFGLTPVKEMTHTVKRFNQNGVEVKGVILNSVERKASSYYGYGYNYQYGYVYKS